jgi:hypothetical protein
MDAASVETGAMRSLRRHRRGIELDLVGEVAVVHRGVSFASFALPDETLALWSPEVLIEPMGLGEQAALAFPSDVEDRAGDLVFQAPQGRTP